MTTYKRTKAQAQSYYAIRVFGLVHLLAAIAIVVLIDGPGDGLGWIAWGVIGASLVAMLFLSVQLYRATVQKSIYCYIVLSGDTVAVGAPGQPTRFLHRRDCAGFVPYDWTFVFR